MVDFVEVETEQLKFGLKAFTTYSIGSSPCVRMVVFWHLGHLELWVELTSCLSPLTPHACSIFDRCTPVYLNLSVKVRCFWFRFCLGL